MSKNAVKTAPELMTLRPLNDRILVQRCEAPDTTPGGLVIPDSAKTTQQEAEVIEVGPGNRSKMGERMPLDVQPGDRILISKHIGYNITLNDEGYTVIQEEDILGVLQRVTDRR